MNRPLPPARALTRAQYSGWACCWCGKSLAAGGVLAGRAQGRIGVSDLSVEVYACPECAAPTISRTPPSPNPEEACGARPSTPRAVVHNRRKK